jgi:hypothetical protein
MTSVAASVVFAIDYRHAPASRWRASRVTSVRLEIPWAEHSFDLVPNGVSG